MRKFLIGAALALTTATAPAQAADMAPGYYNPGYGPVVAAYTWMGPYIGAQIGYGWGNATGSGTKPSGVIGGLHAGYNWQTGGLVLGGEADVTFSGAEDTFASWKFTNPWFSTIRGRAGIAMNNILFYGTVGLAIGELKATTPYGSESKTHTGWTAGVGLEVAMTQNWSARAEYLYLDLSERGYAVTGVSNGLDMNQLRLGVSYRF